MAFNGTTAVTVVAQKHQLQTTGFSGTKAELTGMQNSACSIASGSNAKTHLLLRGRKDYRRGLQEVVLVRKLEQSRSNSLGFIYWLLKLGKASLPTILVS